jgi:putative endonuclease
MLRKLLNLFRREPVSTGTFAEGLAADWLRRERGFAILARNWRNPRDQRQEIDLVCQDREVLVFVEVKARAADALVPGYYAVDARKKRALTRACKAYLAGLHPRPLTFRLDVVEVSMPLETKPPGSPNATVGPEVLHFENVPLFSKEFRG